MSSVGASVLLVGSAKSTISVGYLPKNKAQELSENVVIVYARPLFFAADANSSYRGALTAAQTNLAVFA
jgi:hypothetical protein